MVDYTVAGVEGGLCAPRGFRAAAVDAGLAPGPGPDLGLVVSQQTSVAAGRFTSHPFASAPVRWSRAQLRSGMARVVLVHAGSANAATGPEGDADAAAVAARCAAAIGCAAGEVVLLGTGAIGVRLAVADAAEAADKAAAALGRRGSGEVAKAMTASGGVAREHAVAVAWSEGEVRIGGAAKASVPFAPAFAQPPPQPEADPAPGQGSSATTLVVLTTDATVEPGALDGLLGRAVARSFERVMVDQAPGMADAAVLLANSTAAAPTLRAGSDGAAAFESALTSCASRWPKAWPCASPGPASWWWSPSTGPPTTPTPWPRPGRWPDRWRCGPPWPSACPPGRPCWTPWPPPGWRWYRDGSGSASARSLWWPAAAPLSTTNRPRPRSPPKPRSTWPSTSASAPPRQR